MAEPNEDEWLGLRAGDPKHYRAYIGSPRYYDFVTGLQFGLLFNAGLRETHRLLDLGCGSLRGGRLFIPYLLPDHYYGVEPNEWLVEAGIAHELGSDIMRVKRPTFSTISDFSLGSLGVRFDFVMAHSVVTHTFPDLASIALSGVRDCLAESGVLIATFRERGEPATGSGWLYPETVTYSWEDMLELAGGAGLAVRRLSWPHPRQAWFAGALDEARVDEVAARVASGKPTE